mmetsp:Transcript_77413/g.227013  ORF Transcript_77413/g.227013 Transcript_77413/m.227013 type:complete len:246 (+) Transcript_77413:1989-2726(+)
MRRGSKPGHLLHPPEEPRQVLAGGGHLRHHGPDQHSGGADGRGSPLVRGRGLRAHREAGPFDLEAEAAGRKRCHGGQWLAHLRQPHQGLRICQGHGRCVALLEGHAEQAYPAHQHHSGLHGGGRGQQWRPGGRLRAHPRDVGGRALPRHPQLRDLLLRPQGLHPREEAEPGLVHLPGDAGSGHRPLSRDVQHSHRRLRAVQPHGQVAGSAGRHEEAQDPVQPHHIQHDAQGLLPDGRHSEGFCHL